MKSSYMQARVPKLDLCGCYEDSTSTQSRERENDLHMLPANPTSHNVNNVKEKTLTNTKPENPTSHNGEKKLSKPNRPIFHSIFATEST
jgi:hypothetical protein